MTDKSPRPSFPRRPDLHKEKRTIPGKRQRIRQRNRRLILACSLLLLILVCMIWLINRKYTADQSEEMTSQNASSAEGTSDGPQQWQEQGAPYIDVQLLTPNEYSRPQLPITQVNYIAIHYTANPGASAQDNRDYFENLSWTHETKVSSHFVIGLEGEVIQCIPSSEMSYATNSRNVDTLSIECCHPDETGKFNDTTYESCVKLAAWLCVRFGLDQDAVIRHYDVTGKECPKYYVDNPQAWEQMKADIQARIQEDKALQ